MPGLVIENVYIPAGGDIADRAANPKFGQKLDFLERMTRWADRLDRPTLLLGDFNIAPLECDVYDHKALLKVVSHTPLEVETLGRLRRCPWLGRSGPQAYPRAGAQLVVVVLSHLLAGQGSRAAARSHVGLAGAGGQLARPTGSSRKPGAGSSARTMCR